MPVVEEAQGLLTEAEDDRNETYSEGSMETIGKGVVLMAALVAVVTAVGASFTWLHRHVSHETFIVLGLCLCGFMWSGVKAFSNNLGMTERIRARLGSMVFDLAILVAIVFFQNDPSVNYIVVGFGFAIPSVWILYQYDKMTHRQCPDCCASVKTQARVCRYCGHQFVESGKPKLYVVQKHKERSA